MPITVLIADAQETFRVGLASIIRAETDITVVGEASDAHEAIDKALKLRPRVILMELGLALHEEGDAISRIREVLPLSMIVVIADSQEERDVFQTLSLGAQGYLLKSCSHMEIAQAVRGVVEGEVILSPSIATNLVRETLNWKRKPKISGREAEVLDLVGKGLTNRDIASCLSLSENTIKTYILRLREKLNLHSRLDLGMYASRRKSNTTGDELTFAPAVEAPMPSPEASGPIYNQEQDAATPMIIVGEHKNTTVLCLALDHQSDAVGQMETDKIQEILGETFDLIIEQIHRYDGIVTWINETRFIALFGVPTAQEHAPQKALSAALSILNSIKHESDQLRARGINIDVRIGINTGLVLTGKSRNDSIAKRYTPVGNTTSLAIKAQDTAPSGTIVVTEDIYSLTKRQFTFLHLSELEIKGIGKPIKTYSVLGYASDKSKIQVSAALGLTRFVGRHREIENLKHAFDEAKLGSVQVVGVSGEAGVGKSRLLLKFREELPNDEFTYVEGSCIHYGDSIPYLPLLQALRYYFDITEGEEEETIRRKMDEKIGCLDNKDLSLLPPLQDILSLKVEDEEYLRLEPVKKKERIFEAVRNLILLESRSRTMLIVLEDCHWTDSPSETLLAYLIDSLSNARVIFILLYRPEWEHQLDRRSNYSQIRLKEFPTNTSAELIGFILGDGEADPELQQFVMDRAGGNPLFLEELLHNLRESGHLRKKQKYMLAAKPSKIKVPASLQAIIAARIDRLKPDIKLILQTAAVIGREFDYRIIENIVKVRQELRSCLLNLQRDEFIYARDLTTEPRYFFKHALTQEVAYQSLRSKTRAELHKRVGREIEKQHTKDIEKFYEVLVYHYSKSDDLEKTAHYLKLLADKASSNFSNWEAIRLYCDAIDALRKQRGRDNQAKELEIRLAMDIPLRSMDYPEGSLDNLQEAEKLAEELDERISKIMVHSKIGWYHMVRGDAALGLKKAEVAFVEAAEAEAPDLAVPVALNVTQVLLNGGNFKEVVRVASSTIALLERTHTESMYRSGMCNENVYCMLLALEGISWASLGEFEKARTSLKKSLSYARGIEDLASIAVALHFNGTVFWLQGDGKTAARYLQEALPSLEKVGNAMLLGACWANLGIACLLQGDCQTAAQYVEKGLELQQSCGVTAFLANFYWVKGWIETETGHLVEARRFQEESLRLAMAHRERCTEAAVRIYLGSAMGKRENPNYIEAEQSLHEGMRICEELGLRPWQAQGRLFLGELYSDMGRIKQALEQLRKAEKSFSEMGMDYWLRRAQDLLRKVEASTPLKESLENLEDGRELAEEPGATVAIQKATEATFEEAMVTKDPDLIVPAAINLVQALQVSGNFRRQIEVGSAAIALLEKTHREADYSGGMANDNVYCALLAWNGIALAHVGEFDKAGEAEEKSLDFARRIDNLASIALALQLRGTVCMMRGDGHGAAEHLQEALPCCEKAGNAMTLGACWANLGIACLLQGDCEAAAQHVDKGLELQQSCGVTAFLANFYFGKGWIETEAGQCTEARHLLEESLRLARDHRERCSEAVARIYLGRAIGKGEDPNYIEAERSLHDGMRILKELELRPWIAQGCLFLGELYADMGHTRKALNNLKKAEAAFSEMGMEYWLRRAQGLLEKLQA